MQPQHHLHINETEPMTETGGSQMEQGLGCMEDEEELQCHQAPRFYFEFSEKYVLERCRVTVILADD